MITRSEAKFETKNLRLITFRPLFLAFFDLLISLGQQGLITLLLKSGYNLGPRRVVLYSPIKLLGFSYISERSHIWDVSWMRTSLGSQWQLGCLER